MLVSALALAALAACGDETSGTSTDDADASADTSTSADDTDTSTSADDADTSTSTDVASTDDTSTSPDDTSPDGTSPDDGSTSTDALADTDTVAPSDDPWSGVAGTIEIVEYYSGGAGEVVGGHVLIVMQRGVPPTRLALVAEEGACRLWLQDTTACPSCDEGTLCGVGGTCAPVPAPADAGTITLTGLAKDLTATPAPPSPYYSVTPEPPIDGLFADGAAITVAIAGADGFPAATTTLGGVSDLDIGSIGLVELVDGKDHTITWTPDGSDATVEVVLQLGWHGLPPSSRIVCVAPDAAGAITIPRALVEAFPYFQVGLFQVPSWIERLDRALVHGPHGPIEVRVASHVYLGVSHTAE